MSRRAIKQKQIEENLNPINCVVLAELPIIIKWLDELTHTCIYRVKFRFMKAIGERPMSFIGH